jgi:hypothetical protein
MTRSLRTLIAIITILAPGLHLASDVMEWANGGSFSQTQLLINYAGFLMMPFMIMGLFAVQRPKIGLAGLAGAVLYSIAFIYFTFTTLYALQESIPNYEAMWNRLGPVYTAHGGLMVAGGLLFGFASIKAGVLRRAAVFVFIAGIIFNFALSLVPVPDIFQIIGSSLRNLGLMGIGLGLISGCAND